MLYMKSNKNKVREQAILKQLYQKGRVFQAEKQMQRACSQNELGIFEEQ